MNSNYEKYKRWNQNSLIKQINDIEIYHEVIKPLYEMLKNEDFVGDTVEKVDCHLTLHPTIEFLDYGEVRPVNRDYVNNELDWYLSEDLCIFGHKGIENNPIWKQCSTWDGKVNSNYGYLVNSYGNGEQYYNVLKTLKKDKNARTGVMIYTRPSLHKESKDNEHAKHDFTCTMFTQFLIRDSRLYMSVVMRSNDAIFGLQNDYSWQRWVMYQLYNDLLPTYPELELGTMHWHSVSMHIYSRHYALLEEIYKDLTESIVYMEEER